MNMVKKVKRYFKNKNILVTGGTGSFGHQITNELVNFNPNKIVLLSNDEDGLYHMRNDYKKYENLIFRFGDVRDLRCMKEVSKDIDIIYHAAALKHVPDYEKNPFEAIQTNILGAKNVRDVAVENAVERVITISTDKAVKPVNVMGMTKALQEKIMLASNTDNWDTKFICVRYGNVLGSRGSVIPFFREKLEKAKPLPITSFKMTRFLLTLSQAIGLVFHATVNGKGGELFVRKMPACFIKDLAEVMAKEIRGKENYPIIEVGIRPGEKINEVLVSEEEMRRVIETEKYFIVYPHGAISESKLISNLEEYRSDNTKILNKNEIASLLRREGWLDKDVSRLIL